MLTDNRRHAFSPTAVKAARKDSHMRVALVAISLLVVSFPLRGLGEDLLETARRFSVETHRPLEELAEQTIAAITNR